MSVNSFLLSVPTFVHIPREAFEEGVVVVSAPDLEEEDAHKLRDQLLNQLEPEIKQPSLVVVNFDTEVLILDEELMRKMGWVRAQ